MRRLTVALVTALALACPPPAMADQKKDAIVAGAILGALIAGAVAAKNKGSNDRFNYATDKVFYPAGMPGVICYTRARMCYVSGHYSTWATREVFQ